WRVDKWGKKDPSLRGDPSLTLRMTDRESFCCHPERGVPKGRINAKRFFYQPLLRTIVRRFLSHKHVVHVALALARVGDPDETRAPAQFGEIGRSDIAHPGLQAADQLFDIGS